MRDYQTEYDLERLLLGKVGLRLTVPFQLLGKQTTGILVTRFRLAALRSQILASTPSDFYINGLGRPAGLDGF